MCDAGNSKTYTFHPPISVSCRIAFLAWYKTSECDVRFYVLCVGYCTCLTYVMENAKNQELLRQYMASIEAGMSFDQFIQYSSQQELAQINEELRAAGVPPANPLTGGAPHDLPTIIDTVHKVMGPRPSAGSEQCGTVLDGTRGRALYQQTYGASPEYHDAYLLERLLSLPYRNGKEPPTIAMVVDTEDGVAPDADIYDVARQLKVKELRQECERSWSAADEASLKYYSLLWWGYLRARTPVEEEYSTTEKSADGQTVSVRKKRTVPPDFDLLEVWEDECDWSATALYAQLRFWWEKDQQRRLVLEAIANDLEQEEREFCGKDTELAEIIVFMRRSISQFDRAQYQKVWELIRDQCINVVQVKQMWLMAYDPKRVLPQEPTDYMSMVVERAIVGGHFDAGPKRWGLVKMALDLYNLTHDSSLGTDPYDPTIDRLYYDVYSGLLLGINDADEFHEKMQKLKRTFAAQSIEERRTATEVVFWRMLCFMEQTHFTSEPIPSIMRMCRTDLPAFLHNLLQLANKVVANSVPYYCTKLAVALASKYASEWRDICNIQNEAARARFLTLMYTIVQNMRITSASVRANNESTMVLKSISSSNSTKTVRSETDMDTQMQAMAWTKDEHCEVRAYIIAACLARHINVRKQVRAHYIRMLESAVALESARTPADENNPEPLPLGDAQMNLLLLEAIERRETMSIAGERPRQQHGVRKPTKAQKKETPKTETPLSVAKKTTRELVDSWDVEEFLRRSAQTYAYAVLVLPQQTMVAIAKSTGFPALQAEYRALVQEVNAVRVEDMRDVSESSGSSCS